MQEKQDIAGLVTQARKAQQQWAVLGCKKRAAIMLTARRTIVQEADAITDTIFRCTGKTRIDALSTEVLPSAMAIGYY